MHLSAGDLLRAERNRPGSDLAETIEDYIQAGRIIPVAVTCSLLERAMNEQIKVRKCQKYNNKIIAFILDLIFDMQYAGRSK